MKPNFDNLLKVLDRGVPDRPTLFEFFLNGPLYDKLNDDDVVFKDDGLDNKRVMALAFYKAGYDYATISGSDFRFPRGEVDRLKTLSLNDGNVITDRKSFNDFEWFEPDDFEYNGNDILGSELPEGMKIIVNGPGGVLENVISLMGYDNLCIMTYDDKKLVGDIFDAVGSRLVRYYELSGKCDYVGAMISNDDWGFKTQTMLSPEQMRKYVFPWHKKIVDVIHNAGKPAILHSCGFFDEIAEDVIGMGYDGKHSYEDVIMPVEECYEKYGSRIAILGGIDLDYICRHTEKEIYDRAKAMLERTKDRGSFGLGTGNSVPEYIDDDKYFALIDAARDQW